MSESQSSPRHSVFAGGEFLYPPARWVLCSHSVLVHTCISKASLSWETLPSFTEHTGKKDPLSSHCLRPDRAGVEGEVIQYLNSTRVVFFSYKVSKGYF